MTLSQAAPSLRRLRPADAKPVVKGVISQFKDDDVPSLAAGVAFRIFLSLFPALFAAVAAFSLVVSGEQIMTLLDDLGFVPQEVREQLQRPVMEFFDQAGGGATLTVVAGILGGMWAASSAAVLLARALTRIFGSAETRRFLALRFIGLTIALALFVALVALMVLLVAGGTLQRLLLDALALPPDVEATAGAMLTVGRYLLATLVLVVLFAFVYWIGPDRQARPRFRWLSPGAVLGVSGWILASVLFGAYTRVAGENEVYGALGGVIVLLLWLQITMMILLMGAELNAELRRFAAARIVRGDGGTRPPVEAEAVTVTDRRRDPPAQAPRADGDGGRIRAVAAGARSALAAAVGRGRQPR